MPGFLFWLSLLIFCVWFIQTVDLVPGVIFKINPLRDFSRQRRGSPKAAAPSGLRNDMDDFPKISVIFAARNEASSVREAVSSLLAQDYPDFEVIAVNDRSTDETLSILQSFSSNSRLKILNITDLPPGWLGKTHALYEGYRISSGEHLLFTDADVFFAPETLKAAASAFSHSRKGGNPLDHLVLFPKLLTESLLEKAFTQAFGLALLRRFRPWASENPKSTAHLGIGAFNMIRREAYRKIGTHERLALEVVDDMTLGRRVKEKGLRQRVMSGFGLISVRWVANAGGVVKSLEKNAFAGMDYKISTLLSATLAMLMLDIFPFFGAFVTRGPGFYLNLGTWLCLFLISWTVCRKVSGDWRIFWTHPFASLLLLYCFWRSAFLTLRAGGVRWRDTFYSLEELRRSSSFSPDRRG